MTWRECDSACDNRWSAAHRGGERCDGSSNGDGGCDITRIGRKRKADEPGAVTRNSGND